MRAAVLAIPLLAAGVAAEAETIIQDFSASNDDRLPVGFIEDLALFDPATGTLNTVTLSLSALSRIIVSSVFGQGTATVDAQASLSVGGDALLSFSLADSDSSCAGPFIFGQCSEPGRSAFASDTQTAMVSLLAGADDLSAFIGTGTTPIAGLLPGRSGFSGLGIASRFNSISAEVVYDFDPADTGSGGPDGPAPIPAPGGAALLLSALVLLGRRARHG